MDFQKLWRKQDLCPVKMSSRFSSKRAIGNNTTREGWSLCRPYTDELHMEDHMTSTLWTWNKLFNGHQALVFHHIIENLCTVYVRYASVFSPDNGNFASSYTRGNWSNCIRFICVCVWGGGSRGKSKLIMCVLVVVFCVCVSFFGGGGIEPLFVHFCFEF